MVRPVTIKVLGIPAPKGSKEAMVVPGKNGGRPRAVTYEGKKSRSWEALVRDAVLATIGERSAPVFIEQPIRVALLFRLPRPAGHWGKRGLRASAPQFPHRKPDIDKLVRSTLDALTGSVFDDDARVVHVTADKVYAVPGREGVEIVVDEGSV